MYLCGPFVLHVDFGLVVSCIGCPVKYKNKNILCEIVLEIFYVGLCMGLLFYGISKVLKYFSLKSYCKL